MSAALPKGSATPPRTSTALRNDLSARPLRGEIFGNCAPSPTPSKFLADADCPARAEAAREPAAPAGGEPGGAWQSVGEAAWRAFARLQAGQQPAASRGRVRR